ncbi:MAG: hypothetical protein AAF721_06385 [Myxococcota bacterium]
MMELRQVKSAAGWLGVGLILATPACNRSPDSDGLGDGESGQTPTTSGAEGTTTSPGTPSGGTADGGSTDGGAKPPQYDVSTIPDAPGAMGCGGGGGGGGINEPLYSFIWIANSSEGTVSKIDTVTLEEVGRYRTHPSNGDPSRTSVSLNGDVAVANRNGGLVKFYANQAHCEDRNGNGMIDTSTGAADVLAWDDEECRAWFTPFDYSSQRPVAWTPGQWDPSECRYENTKVWTSGANDGGGFGKGGGGGDEFEGVRVVLVDGNTGEVDHAVKVLEVEPQYYGIYGGAVDSAGNFWGSQLGQGDLIKVDLQTQEYNVWPMGSNGYGMTVDSSGYVWVCSYQVGRFDPLTETWDSANVNGGGGCMEDGNGTLWLASQPLVGIDTETMAVVATYNLPDYVHGVSIDFQGYVWGVSMNTSAYRVDPLTGDFETVNGLNYPYTYSDMTGFALANAGGWTPAG